jgi:predicted Zn-dependent protease
MSSKWVYVLIGVGLGVVGVESLNYFLSSPVEVKKEIVVAERVSPKAEIKPVAPAVVETKPLKIENESKPIEPPLTSPLFSGEVPGFPKLDSKTQSDIEQARKLMGLNKPEEAISFLEKKLQSDPNNEFMTVELALLQSNVMQRKDKAEEMLHRLVNQKPESKMAAAALGDLYVQQGKLNEALPLLQKAASGEKTASDAHTQLGFLYIQMMSKNPNSANIHFPEAKASFTRAEQVAEADRKEIEAKGESPLLANQKVGIAALNLANLLYPNEEGRQKLEKAESLLGADNQNVIELKEKYAKAQQAPSSKAE